MKQIKWRIIKKKRQFLQFKNKKNIRNNIILDYNRLHYTYITSKQYTEATLEYNE